MISNTYRELCDTFDKSDYTIKPRMSEIETVNIDMFGQEESNEYEMEIWITVEISLTAVNTYLKQFIK